MELKVILLLRTHSNTLWLQIRVVPARVQGVGEQGGSGEVCGLEGLRFGRWADGGGSEGLRVSSIHFEVVLGLTR